MRQQAALLLKRAEGGKEGEKEGGKLGALLIRPERLSNSQLNLLSINTTSKSLAAPHPHREKSKHTCLRKWAKNIIYRIKYPHL